MARGHLWRKRPDWVCLCCCFNKTPPTVLPRRTPCSLEWAFLLQIRAIGPMGLERGRGGEERERFIEVHACVVSTPCLVWLSSQSCHLWGPSSLAFPALAPVIAMALSLLFLLWHFSALGSELPFCLGPNPLCPHGNPHFGTNPSCFRPHVGGCLVCFFNTKISFWGRENICIRGLIFFSFGDLYFYYLFITVNFPPRKSKV